VNGDLLWLSALSMLVNLALRSGLRVSSVHQGRPCRGSVPHTLAPHPDDDVSHANVLIQLKCHRRLLPVKQATCFSVHTPGISGILSKWWTRRPPIPGIEREFSSSAPAPVVGHLSDGQPQQSISAIVYHVKPKRCLAFGASDGQSLGFSGGS